MLLTFRVRNFRSLRDEQELSLTRRPATRDATSDGDAAGLLPPEAHHVTAIYGANASGKSNVLEALINMGVIVSTSHRGLNPGEELPVEPFCLDDKHETAPSFFEVEVLIDQIRYTYGFLLSTDKIHQEWLYAYPFGRRQVWFERDTSADDEFYFGKTLGGRNKTIASFTRPNALYLSVAAANNHEKLDRVYRWFYHHLLVAEPENWPSRAGHTVSRLQDGNERSRILDLLRAADLGIRDVTVRELVDDSKTGVGASTASVMLTDGEQRTAPTTARRPRLVIEFEHESGTEGKFIPFDRESLGTRVWFGLVGPLADVLSDGSTLLIDELDASLHPTLSATVLKIFRDPQTNTRGAQVLFTTHDTSLLGNIIGESRLRRDEIWFTEKDSVGASTLFPLTDFTPRKAENLERGYLQGRYGAVPFLDNDYISQILTAGGDTITAIDET